MRIAINALPARIGGGLTYLMNLLPALERADPENDYLILASRAQESLRARIPGRFEQRVVDIPRNYVLRTFWEQFVLPLLLRRWGIDVLITTGNVTSLLAPCAKVMVMTGSNHMSPLDLPRVFGGRVKQRLIAAFSHASARLADRLIFISHDSRDLMLPRLGVAESRTRVIHYGWAPVDPSSLRSDLRTRIGSAYVLTVCVLFPHKNLERLMLAFDAVCTDGYEGMLVIAGGAVEKSYFSELEAFRKSIRHGDRIIFTGELSQAEIAELYRGATVFVFPSLEETLGVPVLEAMGYGVPMCLADTSLGSGRRCFNPFREIAGDAAVYFDPFDPRSIAASLGTLLSDEKLRAELVQRGADRIRTFTWDRAAAETVSVIGEAVRRVSEG